jgi:hypothetical protein
MFHVLLYLILQIMPDIFLFEHPRLTRRSVLPSLEHHENLSGERDVCIVFDTELKNEAN